jgi:hypothetical protein
VRYLSPTLLLGLALGMLSLAGCQTDASSPTAAVSIQVTQATEAVLATATTVLEPAQDGGAENEATPAAKTSVEPARTANADVEFVRATQEAGGTWRFDVTVRHPDSGWEDYADGWDVVTPEGQVLKANEGDPFTRLLLHPHENEQPFTRSQSGIAVPDGVSRVTIRAHDMVDGFGGQEIEVDLTVDQGPGFEASRQ